MPFDAILFDKDGTLVDFDMTWGPAAYEVMMTLAAGDDSAFRRLCDVSRFNSREKTFAPDSAFITGALDTIWSLWAQALQRRDVDRLREEIRGLVRICSLASLTPIGQPGELMRELAEAGLKLGVISNDSEASIRLQLGKLGVDEWLDFIAGQDSGWGAKPAPGMIVAFSAAAGIAPHRIAVVGDTMADVLAARAAGAVSIGVLTGPAHHEDLAQHADYVIDSAGDLPALIADLAHKRRSSANG